jgi:hypothetical protein
MSGRRVVEQAQEESTYAAAKFFFCEESSEST